MKETHPPAFSTLAPGKGRNHLPPVALTALRSIQTTMLCPKSFEFFLEGQPALGIYILYAGSVELSVTDSHGGQMVLGTALPGDVLGLSAALSGPYHEETAAAAVTCQAGFVRCQDFLRFLGQHPEAAYWVVQLLSERVTTTLDQLSCLQLVPARVLRQ